MYILLSSILCIYSYQDPKGPQNANISRECIESAGLPCSNVVFSKSFVSFLTEIPENKKNLPVARRGHVEEKHRLVPRGYFRAWDISTFSPCVSFAFNDDFLLLISKVEVVRLPSIDADFKRHAGGQVQALLSEEILSLGLKITTKIDQSISWSSSRESSQSRRI